MICKSQWVEQTEKAFEQTILNKDKINKVNTGSKNNSFLFPTLTFQLYFLLCCANRPFHSFFFNFFHGQVRENLLTPLEELLKVVKFYRGLYGGGGGGGGNKLAPGSGVSRAGLNVFF